MTKLLAATAVLFGVLSWSPSFAASAETDAFVANVRLNAAFLVGSSALATDRSQNSNLRAFADRETQVDNAIISAIDRRRAPEVAQSLPLTVAANDVVTGRSVAHDGIAPAPMTSAPVGSGAIMPAAVITMGHLAASQGRAFDALYKTTQINALRQLSGIYKAYALTGDDAALKQMATIQLAATNERIADIARL